MVFGWHSLLIACSLVVIDFHHRAIAVLQPKPVHNRMNRVPVKIDEFNNNNKKKRSRYQSRTNIKLNYFIYNEIYLPYHPQRWNFRLHRFH